MSLEFLILAITILMAAWALERLFSRLQSVERHIQGIRKRLTTLETRTANETSSSFISAGTAASQVQRAAPVQAISAPQQIAAPQQNLTAPAAVPTGKQTLCSFCGMMYDINSDKCPKCNHINVDKYRMRKKPGQDKDAGSDL